MAGAEKALYTAVQYLPGASYVDPDGQGERRGVSCVQDQGPRPGNARDRTVAPVSFN